MSKFFKSFWSDLAGAAIAVGGALTIPDIVHQITTGKILATIAAIVGGAFIGAGRGGGSGK